MKALSNEIAKNLVLAGIGSMTIQDDQLVTEDDLGAQFFIEEQHVGLKVCKVVQLFTKADVLLESPSRSTPNTQAQPTGIPLR